MQGRAEKENNLPSFYSSPSTLMPTSLTPLPLDFLFLFFPLRGNKEEKKILYTFQGPVSTKTV